MFTQLNPPLPVTVIDKGQGLALAVIDYGPEHNLLWVTALDRKRRNLVRAQLEGTDANKLAARERQGEVYRPAVRAETRAARHASRPFSNVAGCKSRLECLACVTIVCLAL